MSPRYLRYRFPATVPDDGYPDPERRARAMAALFLAIPPAELSPARLDSEAIMLTDRGAIEYAEGEPAGEELSTWLRLLVGAGARHAWLDVDVELMGLIQRAAMRE